MLLNHPRMTWRRDYVVLKCYLGFGCTCTPYIEVDDMEAGSADRSKAWVGETAAVSA